MSITFPAPARWRAVRSAIRSSSLASPGAVASTRGGRTWHARRTHVPRAQRLQRVVQKHRRGGVVVDSDAA
ncbi:MAG TPA: hypothetical protein VHK90_15320, partial [Thermoanaerobaculia bacterium]|nr:hypothetical protein [Thermoanaerobaculia bacterium]